jgi:rRNA maturation endonuclease Nob1
MKFLVVDSGPLIKGVRLERIEAEHYVTVPEVLLEIRDRQARQLISTLPVELETREPSDEAVAAGTAAPFQTHHTVFVFAPPDLRSVCSTRLCQADGRPARALCG